MRIGRNGKCLDNAHAGGMFVGVTPSGQLAEYAYTEQGEKFIKHPDTDVIFADCKIEKLSLVSQRLKRNAHDYAAAWNYLLECDVK